MSTPAPLANAADTSERPHGPRGRYRPTGREERAYTLTGFGSGPDTFAFLLWTQPPIARTARALSPLHTRLHCVRLRVCRDRAAL